MELYKKSDIELIDKNIDKIVEEIEIIKKEIFGDKSDPRPSTPDTPTGDTANAKEKVEEIPKKIPDPPKMEDVEKIVKIVLNFVKEKKRKIYGGYAHNKAIVKKNPDDAIYNDADVPDIDVYSPEPIDDLVELCDLLYNDGYTDVVGKEAIHGETYKIFTRGYNAIDLSYVPRKIFYNIPFIPIDDIQYVHPTFAMMDLYKMLSEPMFSSFRWKKTIPRLYLLQKYYPFEKNDNDLKSVYEVGPSEGLNIVLKFVENNPSVYLFGEFAYNKLLSIAKINKNEIVIPFYRIVSINYKDDVKKIIDLLTKSKIGRVEAIEYYPLMQLNDYNVEIKCGGKTVAHVYKHQHRCIPVKNINNVQIGCFDYILLMEMVLAFSMKIENNSKKKLYHNTIISHLIKMRNKYLDSTKKTMLDDTIFQSMITKCIGETYNPIASAWEKRKQKKDEGKPMMFMYKPIKELKNKWVFANTSGSKINNPKNYRINFVKK